MNVPIVAEAPPAVPCRKGAAGPRTLSVIIPALNEEGNLDATLENVVTVVRPLFDDYQIVVVDDGSRDRTPQIAAEWARRDARIQVVTHPRPTGFGSSYNAGRSRARMTYCVMIHGDNAFGRETLHRFLSHTGRADVVAGYIANPESRNLLRRGVSALYTGVVNLLFGFRLRYFNGLQIHRTAWLRSVPIRSSGFAFQAELLIQALRAGMTVTQVPTFHQERPGGGTTKIFKPRNIVSVLRTLLRLRFESAAPSRLTGARADV